MGSVLPIFIVFCVVLLCVFTFCVLCIDIPCDVCIKTMFISSLPPVVCRRTRVLFYVICVCLHIVVSNTYCVVLLFCLSSSCVPYIASFSRLFIVDCPSVLSNVYFMQLQIIFLNLIVELQSQHTTRSDQLPNSTAAQHKLPEYVHLLSALYRQHISSDIDYKGTDPRCRVQEGV